MKVLDILIHLSYILQILQNMVVILNAMKKKLKMPRLKMPQLKMPQFALKLLAMLLLQMAALMITMRIKMIIATQLEILFVN